VEKQIYNKNKLVLNLKPTYEELEQQINKLKIENDFYKKSLFQFELNNNNENLNNTNDGKIKRRLSFFKKLIQLNPIDTIPMENGKRYLSLLNNIMYPIIVTAFDKKILFVNKRSEDYFGSIDAAIKKDVSTFWENPNKRIEFIEAVKRNGFVHNREVLLKNYHGETYNALLSSNVINYFGQTAILSVFNDITKLKQLENKILTVVIETEEKERQRFAQELHDGIGPLLSTVNMYIQWLLKPKSQADKIKTLEKINDIVKEAHESIHQIAFNLSPHVLRHFGFIEALNVFIEKVKEFTSISIIFKPEVNFVNKIITETILYRILTECITNTIKHADASEISIVFSENEDKLIVNYSDNGKGFNINDIDKNGLGLLNMQNRIKSINGIFRIESSLGKGTKIFIEVNKIKENIKSC
jgi:PAS domain S-box-containing protein